MSSLKYIAASKAVETALALSSHASDQNIEQLLSILEWIAPAKDKAMVRSVQQQWTNDEMAGPVIKRLIRELNPKAREQLVANLVLNAAWGPMSSRREEFIAEHGFKPPFAMLISPTMRCNLNCAGCYAGDYDKNDELSFELMDRILTEAKSLDIFFITVLGGEPFIRPDLWDLFEKHSDIYFQVYTNGTLLNQGNVDRLARTPNVATMISIEGFEAETDARRGKGTYREILAAMDRLHAAGVLFGFSSMVTRMNLDVIISDEFNDMLVEKGAFVGWHFLYMPVGPNPDVSLMLTPVQRNRLRQMGAARIRKTRPIFVMDFWNDAPYVGGCIAGGREYLHINSFGGIEPCIFTHFAVDNIKEKSLRECLCSPYFRDIRSRQPYDQNLLRPCMLIDHPEVFRDVHGVHHPHPTHPGAVSLVNELAPKLDQYASDLCSVMDMAWQEDFAEFEYQPAYQESEAKLKRSA